jgi:hypothetical protein
MARRFLGRAEPSADCGQASGPAMGRLPAGTSQIRTSAGPGLGVRPRLADRLRSTKRPPVSQSANSNHDPGSAPNRGWTRPAGRFHPHSNSNVFAITTGVRPESRVDFALRGDCTLTQTRTSSPHDRRALQIVGGLRPARRLHPHSNSNVFAITTGERPESRVDFALRGDSTLIPTSGTAGRRWALPTGDDPRLPLTTSNSKLWRGPGARPRIGGGYAHRRRSPPSPRHPSNSNLWSGLLCRGAGGGVHHPPALSGLPLRRGASDRGGGLRGSLPRDR